LYRLLPDQASAAAYHPYNAAHILESLQVLLFTALGFFLLVKLKKIEPHAGTNLDLDWFYRKGGRAFLWLAMHPIQFVDNCVGEVYRVLGLIPVMLSARLAGLFDNNVIDGLVDGVATSVRAVGNRLRTAQRGALQENLMLAFAAGVVLVLILIVIF
jgi:multicomponent Na+:H+ antiporter subunit D